MLNIVFPGCCQLKLPFIYIKVCGQVPSPPACQILIPDPLISFKLKAAKQLQGPVGI
jgi:hypothetical protein